MDDFEQVLARLTQIENKLDRVSDELAEIRGARKVMVTLSALLGALAGGIVSLWHRA